MQSVFHGARDASIRRANWQYIALRGPFCPRGAQWIDNHAPQGTPGRSAKVGLMESAAKPKNREAQQMATGAAQGTLMRSVAPFALTERRKGCSVSYGMPWRGPRSSGSMRSSGLTRSSGSSGSPGLAGSGLALAGPGRVGRWPGAGRV